MPSWQEEFHASTPRSTSYLNQLWALWVVDEEFSQVCWQHIDQLVQVIMDNYLLSLSRLCCKSCTSSAAHLDVLAQPFHQHTC